MNKTLIIALLISALVHGLLFLLPDQKERAVEQAEYISYTVTLAEKKPESTALLAAEPIKETEKNGVFKEKTITEKPVPEVNPATVLSEQSSEEADTSEVTEGGSDDLLQQQAEYNRLLFEVRARIKESLVYPRIAKRKSMEGSVGLSFVLTETGRIDKVEIQESSGFRVLDKAALKLMNKISPLDVLSDSDTTIKINIVYDLQGR